MYKAKKTKLFSKWLAKLKDIRGRIAIARRIERMENGNFGDVKPIGGDKSTQSKDIEKAKQLLEEYSDEEQ